MTSEKKENKFETTACAFCGAPGLQAVYKTKRFAKGGQTIIIEKLPVRHCDSCSESYYDPNISYLIDELLARLPTIAEFETGGVARLAGLFKDDPTLRDICEEAYQLRDAEVLSRDN